MVAPGPGSPRVWRIVPANCSGPDRRVLRLPAEPVARPDDRPAADAGPGQQHRPDPGPVVPPALAVQVRRPPELAGGDHERRVEQAPLRQVVEQGRVRRVERRPDLAVVGQGAARATRRPRGSPR